MTRPPRIILALLLGPVALGGGPMVAACSKSAASEADTIASEIAQDACSIIVPATDDNPIALFACAVAQAVGSGVQGFLVQVPASSTTDFAARHPESTASKALAAAYAKRPPGPTGSGP
jgi:hypothetical protein